MKEEEGVQSATCTYMIVLFTSLIYLSRVSEDGGPWTPTPTLASIIPPRKFENLHKLILKT